MLLLLISFLAGILTVLAPCVLPVLPVIVAGSFSGDARLRLRPYVIGASLAVSIVTFTLLLKVSTALINLPSNVLNDISGGLLILLGIAAIAPTLWENLMIRLNLQSKAQQLLGQGERTSNKYISAILIGVALGPVFASCSPTYAFILATVLPGSFIVGLIYLVTYVIGLTLALLAASLVGRKYLSRFSWAIDTHSAFRRALGGLFVIIGIVVATGSLIPVETWVANHLPFDETKLEQVLLAKKHNNSAIKSLSQSALDSGALNVEPTPAPELQGLTNWINSQPLRLSQLKGKVVLVDFWTYSCINCIRSIPYVEKYYQTYAKDGFVVIGVNTPEFAFEHDPANVAAAVARDGITYPVALDNDYDTWNAYSNDSWPADYLIDKSGNIRYVSLGEGDYDKTEEAIQTLLGIHQSLKVGSHVVPVSQSQTPETYFGTNREQTYVGSPALTDTTAVFTPAISLSQSQWTLSGGWQISPDSIASTSDSSTIQIHVNAKDVYLVAGSPDNQPATLGVRLTNPRSNSFGADAPDGSATITGSRLYHIAAFSSLKSSTVTLTVPRGVTLYTFTFGS